MIPMRKIYRARRNGIVNPIIAYQRSSKYGLDYAVACALLIMESSGGHNVFGHDPTIFSGAGKVTKQKYESYKASARRTGLRQGVGPCQLTSGYLQDRADERGGCWRVDANMDVGFEFLASLIKRHGLRRAFYHYNGSWKYAEKAMAVVSQWRRILEGI